MFYKEIQKLKKSELQNLLAETLQQKATLERANSSLINELELKMLHKENSIYIDTPFTIELKKEIRQLHEELRQCKKLINNHKKK